MNQYLNKKETKILLLILITFLLLAIFMIVMIVAIKSSNHARRIDRGSIVTKQEDPKVEEKLIREGQAKMIAGRVEAISDDRIRISVDVDPFGEKKVFQVILDEKTKIMILSFDVPAPDVSNNDGIELVEKIETASMDEIQVGENVEVHFPQRVDLEGSKDLLVEKIVIFPN